jgi:hypothetical protein
LFNNKHSFILIEQVEVNLFVRSMGPVDEGRQIFTLDCYFRQYWTDTRYRTSEKFFKEIVP